MDTAAPDVEADGGGCFVAMDAGDGRSGRGGTRAAPAVSG